MTFRQALRYRLYILAGFPVALGILSVLLVTGDGRLDLLGRRLGRGPSLLAFAFCVVMLSYVWVGAVRARRAGRPELEVSEKGITVLGIPRSRVISWQSIEELGPASPIFGMPRFEVRLRTGARVHIPGGYDDISDQDLLDLLDLLRRKWSAASQLPESQSDSEG